jgi:putative membrane protein
MTPKLSLLIIAASLALVACSTDNMSRRDVGSPDTSGTGGQSYNQSGNPSGNRSMTHVSAREGRTLTEADKAFIRDAGSGGLFEVDAGHKAADKASDNQIKSLGQRMIDDHTRVNKELTDLASEMGFTETPALTGEQNGMLARLDQLNGNEFDRYYVQTEMDDHRKDIAKFEHEASSANDRDLREHRPGYQPGQNEPTGESIQPSNPNSSGNGSE